VKGGLTDALAVRDVLHIAHLDQLGQLLHQVGLRGPGPARLSMQGLCVAAGDVQGDHGTMLQRSGR